MKRTTTIEHNGATYTAEPMIIKSTHLGNEDHGILSAYLRCEGDSTGIAVGGYALDSYDEEKKQRIGTAYGLDHLLQILRVVGAESWEKIAGRQVMVLFWAGDGWGSKAVGIAHPIEDRVLIFEDHAAAWREAAATDEPERGER